MTNEQATLAVGWIGQKAIDRDGRKLGRIADVYVDVGSGLPTWTVVRGGAWRRHARFVPLEGVSGQGRSLQFPLTKPELWSAARVSVDGRLEANEAEALSRHYRLVALDQPAPGWNRLGQAEPPAAPVPAQAPPPAPAQAPPPAGWPRQDPPTAAEPVATAPPPPAGNKGRSPAAAERGRAPVDVTDEKQTSQRKRDREETQR